jgi:Pyruvate/2-oxoacid:ferredoxin oxidoreductase gamma subunit
MSEREVVLTGIGGQGVQLAGQVLARAAVNDGRHAKLFANYGGMMRGGNTEANVVLGDDVVVAPPILASAWAAVVMHHEHWAPVAPKMRPDGIVLVSSDFRSRVDPPDSFNGVFIDLPCTELAVEAGGIVAATMVMLGALCELTQLTSPSSLEVGLVEALPTYRSDAIDLNRRALEVGQKAARELDTVGQATAAWGTMAEPAP